MSEVRFMNGFMDTHGSVNELDVLRALRVTVTSSVLGTSLVPREARHTTIGVHLREVERAVETAGKLGHVDREGELLVLEVERLVLGVGRVHEVDTRANVLLRGLGDELERERVTGSRDTVGALVVSAVERAVGRAGHIIGAERSVPGVTCSTQ